jgi:peptidyl-prolyl cis-trans isomerase D
MREAVHRYGSERRSAAYITLPAASVGDIPAPSEDQLKAFYEERKSSFRAPDYRAINVIAADPASLAKPETVSEADARQRYEQIKDSRFGAAERRPVQQIVFPTAEEAKAAAERIKQGTTFEALAGERNIDPKDLELGTFSKAEMVDPAVADAAFALSEGAVSEPVQGRFGNVLVRVTGIQPGSAKPFEEVADAVRREIAAERSRNEISDLHDQVEDLRASARPLAEIAKEKGLQLLAIPAIDRQGRDKAGNPVQPLPEREALLAAVFGSDIGVDNEALRTRAGGYVWYEVAGIEPARERSFEETREEVAAQWRADQVSRRLADRARGLVERLEKGETIEAVAAEAGVEAKTATDLARRASKGELSTEVVNRMFSVPVGKAASVETGDSRVVFKVTGASIPPFVTTTAAAASLADQLRNLLTEDLLAEYVAQAQSEMGVAIDQQAVSRAVGGEI